MPERIKAHLYVLSANLIFAVNYTVVKWVTPGLIRPFGLNVVRVLATVAIAWMIFPFERNLRRLEKKDIRSIILCGLTGVSINQLFFIKGLSLTLVTHATLIQLSTPILITAISFFLFRERLGWKRVLGLVSGIGGAAWLILGRGSMSYAKDVFTGDMYVLLNSISYSFYFILAKPLLQKYSSFQVVRWFFTLGSFAILGFGWEEFREAPWQDFSLSALIAIGFVAIVATYLAYVLNIAALKHLSPSSIGSYIYIQPVLAAATAAVFLGESFTWLHILSGMFIFLGVYLVNRYD